MADCVAWLAENSDGGDFLLASGRFRGYIDLGPGVGDELLDAGLEEALEWARERAPVVLIRLWDSDYFSAGERNPEPGRFQEWPAEGIGVRRRRPRGLGALDNTEGDPPVAWDVRLTADPAVDQGAFRSAVEADPRTEVLSGDPINAGSREIRVVVRASTQAQAWAIAKHLSDAANNLADPGGQLRSRNRAGRAWVRSGPQVYPFAPDARVRFGGRTSPNRQEDNR